MISTIRTYTIALLTFAYPLAIDSARCDDAIGEIDTISVPVQYDRDALVIVSDQGAAAIRFAKPFQHGNDTGNGVTGVSYEYRFLSREKDAEEQTGVGRVFSKLQDGEVKHSVSVIRCQAASINWQFVGERSGMIEIDPKRIKLHPITQDRYGPSEIEPNGNAGRRRADPMQLAGFLAADKNIKDAIDGSDVDPGKGMTGAAHVDYSAEALVVRCKQGIAAFYFSNTFERKATKAVTHHVTPYKFLFQSHDGHVQQEGESEVYEKYTNNKYNGGELDLDANGVTIHWSKGGESGGWIYYNPRIKQVWRVKPADAKRLIGALR